MKRELRAQWCSALRSGKYQQGPKFLRMDGKYDALGVLLDVARSEGWNPPDVDEVHEWALDQGISPWGALKLGLPNDAPAAIANMCDSGKTFVEIADWIEQHIPATDD